MVNGVVDEQSVAVRAARFAISEEASTGFTAALTKAEALQATFPTVDAVARTAGGSTTIGTFQGGAAQELILFVFLTSLSASAMLIETRRSGVTRRMLASPTSVRTILVGETLGRYAIALVQGLMIVAGTVLLFQVDWGNPLTTGLVVVLFALVGDRRRHADGVGAAERGAGRRDGRVPGAGAGGGRRLHGPARDLPAGDEPDRAPLPARLGDRGIERIDRARAPAPGEVWTKLAVLAGYAIALLGVATVFLRRSITSHAS